MTTQTQPPATAGETDPPRTKRLGNWISDEAHTRLAIHKALTGNGVGLTIDRLVRLHLPCVADMTAQFSGGDER